MSKPLLINIRGTNGSGKSTVPLQMYSLDETKTVEEIGDVKVTIFPKFKFIALGTYHNKTGGMDSIGSTQTIKDSLKYALKRAKELGYDVLMEGILASTVKSTYLEMFQEVERTTNFKVVVLIYTTPVEICLERIYLRNGGKAIRESLVYDKYKAIVRQYDYFNENGIVAKRVDNTNTPKHKMLPQFLSVMKRWRDM